MRAIRRALLRFFFRCLRHDKALPLPLSMPLSLCRDAGAMLMPPSFYAIFSASHAQRFRHAIFFFFYF